MLSELANELGINPQILGGALIALSGLVEAGATPEGLIAAYQVGGRSAQLDALRAINAQAIQLDAALTSQENEAIAPILQARANRQQILTQWQTHEAEQRNQSEGTVTVPVWAELEAQLRGE